MLFLNKKILQDRIEQLEEGIEVKNHIIKVMERFKHYKQVNKRFIDALKESGEFHAYIQTDNYSTKLVVYKSPSKFGYNERRGFSLYIFSHRFTKEFLTWEKIEKELEKSNYKEQLTDTLNLLNKFDEEKEKFKQFYELVNSTNFECFDLHDIKSKLKDMLDVANHPKI